MLLCGALAEISMDDWDIVQWHCLVCRKKVLSFVELIQHLKCHRTQDSVITLDFANILLPPSFSLKEKGDVHMPLDSFMGQFECENLHLVKSKKRQKLGAIAGAIANGKAQLTQRKGKRRGRRAKVQPEEEDVEEVDVSHQSPESTPTQQKVQKRTATSSSSPKSESEVEPEAGEKKTTPTKSGEKRDAEEPILKKPKTESPPNLHEQEKDSFQCGKCTYRCKTHNDYHIHLFKHKDDTMQATCSFCNNTVSFYRVRKSEDKASRSDPIPALPGESKENESSTPRETMGPPSVTPKATGPATVVSKNTGQTNLASTSAAVSTSKGDVTVAHVKASVAHGDSPTQTTTETPTRQTRSGKKKDETAPAVNDGQDEKVPDDETTESYSCTNCDWETDMHFRYHQHLMEHLVEVPKHESSRVMCRFCKKALFIRNSRTDYGKGRQDCPLCDFLDKTQLQLRGHLMEVHGMQHKAQQNQYICRGCSFGHYDPEKVAVHIADDHKGVLVIGETSPVSIPTPADVEEAQKDLAEIKVKPYECPKCQWAFDDHDVYHAHILTHPLTDQPCHSCHYCHVQIHVLEEGEKDNR